MQKLGGGGQIRCIIGNVEVAYKRMYCLQVDERITGGLISGRRREGGGGYGILRFSLSAHPRG